MIRNRLGALSLAALLACSGSVFAGSTGPTNPDADGPKVPGTGMDKNTDGTTPGPKGTSPGTKGMDPEPGKDSSGHDRTHDPRSDVDTDDDDDDGNAP
jgi:hypothetical protein